MKHALARMLSVAAVALLVTAVAGAQGMYMESSISGGPMGSDVHHAKSYLMPKMFKTETGGGETMIIRADKELFYGINPSDKTYWVMTFAELEEGMKRAKGKMDAKMSELQEKMKDMPEAQRKQMESMMAMMGGDKGDKKVEVTPTSEKKEICGYSCTKNVVTSGGKELMTLWIAKGVKGFDALRKDWVAASKKMLELNPMNGKEMMEVFSKLEGYPLESDIMGMTNVVTKLENRSTPASAFDVPAGYKQTDSPMKKGMD
jgi:hypothetical protein